MRRHYHANLSAGLPMSMDSGDPHGLHTHVSYLGDDRYVVVIHNHDGYEAHRTVVPEHRLAEHLEWAARQVGIDAGAE